jgi:hypothetical protein
MSPGSDPGQKTAFAFLTDTADPIFIREQRPEKTCPFSDPVTEET